MFECITYIILIVINAIVLIASISLLSDWHNKMQRWQSAPSILEAIDCLFDGLIGAVGLTISIAILIGGIFAVSHLIIQ